jgi:Piezo non-specific cation channel, R-Ras-binding domain
MTFQQVLKWIIQIVLLFIYHFVIFWLFPLASNDAIYGQPHCNEQSTMYADYKCFDFKKNGYLIVFYIIFCRYFQLSALQIRHGYPDWKNPSSLTAKLDILHYIGNMIFYNLPFLLELKTVLDWCFTKTALDVNQWLELCEINHAMYNAKSGNPDYYNKKIGVKISRGCKQFCGCFCLSVMLFFLVGPFLFFSNLRAIANYNSVTDSRVGIKILISENFGEELPPHNYEFPLFYTNNPISIYPMSEEVFNNKTYNIRPETKFFDWQQVQFVKIKASSDEMWSASRDYQFLF